MKTPQIKKLSQQGIKFFLGLFIGGLFYAQNCQAMQLLKLSRHARMSSHLHRVPQARFYNANGPIENNGPKFSTRQGPQFLKTEFFDEITFSKLSPQKITITDNCVEVQLGSSLQLPQKKPQSEESLRAWMDIWDFEVNQNMIRKPQDPNNYNPMCYLGDDGLYRVLTEEHRQKRIQILIDKIEAWFIIINGQMNGGPFSGRFKEYTMNHRLANEIRNSLKDRLSNPDRVDLAPAIAVQQESYFLYLDSLGKDYNLDELSYQIFRICQDAEEMLRQSSLK